MATGDILIFTTNKLLSFAQDSGLRTQLLQGRPFPSWKGGEVKGSAGRKLSCLLLRSQDTHLLNMSVFDSLAALCLCRLLCLKLLSDG